MRESRKETSPYLLKGKIEQTVLLDGDGRELGGNANSARTCRAGASPTPHRGARLGRKTFEYIYIEIRKMWPRCVNAHAIPQPGRPALALLRRPGPTGPSTGPATTWHTHGHGAITTSGGRVASASPLHSHPPPPPPLLAATRRTPMRQHTYSSWPDASCLARWATPATAHAPYRSRPPRRVP